MDIKLKFLELLFPFLFIMVLLSLLSFFIVMIFIENNNKKRTLRNSRQEVEKLLQEKNKQQAYEIVRKNYAADLIHFRLTDFIGPAFKDLRKFLFRLGNNYNSEDFKKYFLNNKYKDEDIDKFSKLYVDAVEKALMR